MQELITPGRELPIVLTLVRHAGKYLSEISRDINELKQRLTDTEAWSGIQESVIGSSQ